MPYQELKMYQTGTYAVGNRLLETDQRTVQSRTDRSNSLTSGHRACQGCGEALGARYVLDAAMRATRGELIAANATGCLEVFSTPFPESSWQLPWIHSLFGNTAAVATGIAAAMRVKGRHDVRVVHADEVREVGVHALAAHADEAERDALRRCVGAEDTRRDDGWKRHCGCSRSGEFKEGSARVHVVGGSCHGLSGWRSSPNR